MCVFIVETDAPSPPPPFLLADNPSQVSALPPHVPRLADVDSSSSRSLVVRKVREMRVEPLVVDVAVYTCVSLVFISNCGTVRDTVICTGCHHMCCCPLDGDTCSNTHLITILGCNHFMVVDDT